MEKTIICYDNFSGQYFRSTFESIDRAMKVLNWKIILNGELYLRDITSAFHLEEFPFDKIVAKSNGRYYDEIVVRDTWDELIEGGIVPTICFEDCMK